jgi:hypothetical protein
MLQHRLAPRRILQLLLMLRDLLAACRTAGVRDSRAPARTTVAMGGSVTQMPLSILAKFSMLYR